MSPISPALALQTAQIAALTGALGRQVDVAGLGVLDRTGQLPLAPPGLSSPNGACRLFRVSGFDEAEAQARSLLLYAYVFGVSLMRHGAFTSDIAALKTRIAGLIAPH